MKIVQTMYIEVFHAMSSNVLLKRAYCIVWIGGHLILEIIVGVSGCEPMFGRLIENRISGCAIREKSSLKVKKTGGNYVKVSWKDKSDAFILCDVFADIIIESLQVRYLSSLFKSEYEYIPVSEQGEILILAVKKLWYGNTGSEHLGHVKCNVSARIACCLFENPCGILSLDGIMRFRMQDYIETWNRVFHECVEHYYAECEKKEFIKLLRYYVCMRESKLSVVHLKTDSAGETTIFDDTGRRVEVTISGEAPFQVNTEDMLLSKLIVICPEQIVIDSHMNGTLEQLIKQVFVGRVRSDAY